MFYKLIADTFSVARDSDHFIQLKTLKKPKTDDQVWVALEIVDDSKFARSTAQSIIETLDAVFFENPEIAAYERFEAALKEVNIIINSIKEKRGKSFGRINAILAIFTGEELHLTQSNDAEAYLIRNGKLSLVSEGLASRSADLFVNIASGEIRPDDKLIFATGRLLRVATHSQLIQLFGDGVTEAIESLREVAMRDEELSLGAACIHTKLLQKPDEAVVRKDDHPFVIKIKEIFGKIYEAISLKMGSRMNGVNKKNILVALALIVVILVASVSFLMQSQRSKAIREEYRTKIEKLHADVQVANTKGYANDKTTANAILEKVDAEARAILDSNYFRAETLALLDKVQEVRDSINHTDRVKELAPFIDLKTKKADAKAIGMTILEDNLYVFGYNTLFEIILDQILEPRTIDDTEIAIAGTAMEDQKVLVFLTQSGRIIEYENGKFHFANTEDQKWKGGIDLAAYGKNIYVLNPGDNQIYKYSRLRDKYSAATDYNSDAELKDAISLAIDGDVYALKKGGTIVRIYKSKVQNFKINDLAVDLTDASQLYTSPELDNLYILDTKNKRVVIIAKAESGNARYFGQVVFDKLGDVQDFYVDKSEKKLYLLTSQEVYKIDI